MKILFISDYYLNEIVGGAEICNDILINELKKKSCHIDALKSKNITIDVVQKYDFVVIANFFQLSESIKYFLSTALKKKYVVYEHDHKYASNNNPASFAGFLIDEAHIINKDFYKNALAVLAQSKMHAEIIQKNLLLSNIINLGGNLWDEEKLSLLEKHSTSEKTIKNAILETNNKNKGMIEAVQFCNKNNIQYQLLPFQKYENFIETLAKVENLFFFPQWVETFSRVSVEAKILGCKLITNKMIGASSEEFFKFSPNQIIEHLKKNNIKIVTTFLNLINDLEVEYFVPKKMPKVSIITSLYGGGEFIENFLFDITRQTIFEECELLILDANSPDNEIEVINKYRSGFNNIKYFKFEERLNVHQTLNKGIEYSTGDFLTIANVDDRRTVDCLETLRKHLVYNTSIDLVYGDCLITTNKNELVENCKSNTLYEHSVGDFSKENMIKCLPGPIPMWKKNMSLNNGLFSEQLKFAGDWEFWLRCVKNGCTFKKVNKIVGSYYNNPAGLTTDIKNKEQKITEERQIFVDYKEIVGYNNFEKYRFYFNV